QTSFIEEIVIYGAHSVIKITFLLFYLRLSVGQMFRGFVYLGFALAFSVFLSSLLMTVLQCIPFEKILNPMLHPEVTCIDMRVMMLTPPILNIFMDLYIICLPIPSVLTLRMNLRRKVTVISVLAFGIISVTVAILRLPVLISVSSMKTDLSIDAGKMIIVASFEVQCAIVAANLPAMKALWRKVRGKYSSAGSYERSKEKPYRLSSMRRELWNKRASMGTITRLEQGLTGNESQVELVEGIHKQPGPLVFGFGESHSNSVKSSRQNSIIVTTELDVRHTPRL
ncbi:hypothetical protein BKA58DRAFT_326344, partial [Alternaria rosae]|uniref:uncharacterized protein n=1 Tax=Alternaria rosae TaxID=1187941 RepID=UPI001E8EAB4F